MKRGKDMKVLLTGGAGFIGSHTAVRLIECGHEVVIADNFVNSKPAVLERLKKLTGADIAFYEADMCDENKVEEIFSRENIDAVIHFAGLKAVGESVKQPLRYYRNNIDSTLTLLEVMKRHNVNNIIFSSSATVYGDPSRVPITEDMPVGNCTNPYGKTKYFIEHILSDAAAADPELSVVLLRYFNPIGAHQSGLLCEDPNGIPNNLMPYIMKVAAGKIDHLGVFGNDYPTHDGTGVRDYIHILDLAEGHADALTYAKSHKGVEVFNLGTGTGYSVLDLVESFKKVNNVDVPYQFTARRDGDIATCYASPEKAEKLLNWKAKYNVEDMCRDAWNAALKNPNGYEG